MLFRREPSEVSKNERMKFIALKTKDGELKGDIFFYCRTLHVSRQGFYRYLANKDRPWKYGLVPERTGKLYKYFSMSASII